MQEMKISAGKRPHNPLSKRVWRDIVRDFRRYLMIFLMLVITIGFVSGMYVANNSMMTTLDNNNDKLHLEDGHFELSRTADEALIKNIESGERADLISIFRERAYKEAEPEVLKAVDEEVMKTVRENVEKAITENVEKAVDEQLAPYKSVLPADEYTKRRSDAVKTALTQALDEKLDEAVNEAFEKAKESDEYKDALKEADKKAKDEINKKIDEEYAEISERYDLDDESFSPVKVSVYELFYKQGDEGSATGTAGKIRVFSERTEVNLYDLLEGRAPQNEREIIIDRMHADNAGISVGDTISVGTESFKVVGLAAFVDYSTLYESNNDTMFDALTFNVAMTTKSGFERIKGRTNYVYAFCYDEKPADVIEEKKLSDNFMISLITQTAGAEGDIKIEDYVPRYANHAVSFAPDDMGSDKAMGGVLLYILTAVLAFIFTVTISSTLEKESTVIGTLRASGYTRGELVRYYMSAPIIVITAAAIVGNILGYTVMKKVVTAMYYNSYSLPTYVTIWTPDAFVRTTIVPILMMIIINLVIITKTLKLSPLKFLRRDLRKTRRKKAIRLPKWKFFARFRARVFIQNIPSYLMLFVGICFIMLLLSMAVGMPETLKYYQESLDDMMISKYEVILMSSKDDDGDIIETKAEGAERFSAASLERRSETFNEEITVYGITPNSRFVTLGEAFSTLDDADGSNDAVYISKAYADKYNVKKGDVITLDEKYENKQYKWTVYDIYDYSAGVAVFMTNDRFNEEFDRKADEFSGYLSNEPVDDIDEKYIAKVITADDMTKLARQLDHSMGSYMKYFQYVCVAVAAIIIYLLMKIIIERNERSVSMVKILGYGSGEIASLYLVTTAIVVLVSEIFAVFVGYRLMAVMWHTIMMTLGGWFDFKMTAEGFVTEFVLVFIAYLIVAIADFIRIKRIPKALALKNAE